MLLEEDKLRWLGLDVRPRWRRRVLVVLTYAIYLMVLYGRWPRISGMAWPLCMLGLIFQGNLLHEVEAWGVWIFQSLLVLVMGFQMYSAWLRPDPRGVVMSPVFLFLWLVGSSALGINQFVDKGDRGWMGHAVKNPIGLSGRQQRSLARIGFIVGLDGYSWYEYLRPFRRLTVEEKRKVEELSKAHPRGEWTRTQTKILFDDERLRYDEERLRAQVQRVLSWVLVLVAVVVSTVLAGKHTVDKNLLLFVLWVLAGLVTTLRQAIVLWTERDPRDLAGEITLIDGLHA